MLSLREFYIILFIFWFTYIVGCFIFPSSSQCKINKRDIIIRLFINFLVTAVMIPFISYIPQVLYLDYSLINILIRLLLLIVMAEIWFYYMHRLMHNKYMFKWHKDHHMLINCAFGALYCSPIEMVLVNQLSLAVPLQLLGFYFVEIIIINIITALNILRSHGNVISNNKWISGTRIHELHHRRLTCNYGIFYFLDIIHNTYIED